MGTVSFEVPGPGTYQVECDPKLPALANGGSAGDILQGKQFYNDQNQVVTGSLVPEYAGMLVVTVDAGAEVTATDGTTTLTATSTGTATFHLPNGGTWTVFATLDGKQSDPATVEVQENFSVALSAGASQTVNIPTQYEAELSFSRLPDGYTELEYIKLGSNCGIDTLFKPNMSTSRIVMDFQIDGSLSTDMMFLSQYGTKVSGLGTRWVNLFVANSSALGYRDNSNSYGTLNPDLSKKMVFDYNCPAGTVSAGHVTKTLNRGTYTLSYDVFFGSPSSQDKIAPFRIYSSQFYTNDTKVHDFVPCKNPSNVVGLYDLVSKTFCRNSLDGTIIPGPAV